MKVKTIIAIVLSMIILGIGIAITPFTTVDDGERVVVLRLGTVTDVFDGGFHWYNPFTESLKSIDIRVREMEATSESASKDLQDVKTVVSLNYSVERDKAAEIYKEYKTVEQLETDVIQKAVQDIVKKATAEFTAEQLITKREDVKNVIQNALTNRLKESYVDIKYVNIVDFRFSQSFNASIEAKVKAEQDALTAKNDLERVKYEQQQEIEKYKAQAEATALQAKALAAEKGSEYLELKKLEVQMEYAKKWNGQLPQQFVPGSTIPFIDVSN